MQSNTPPARAASSSSGGLALGVGYHRRAGSLVPGYVLKQRYRITSLLGNGGFGAVYRAEDAQFGKRLVAVKEMNHGGLTRQEIVGAAESFKREALLLAQLKHPSLPSIYDHFTEAGRWYLVMDFIDGETLESRLQRVGRMRVEEVLHVGTQLCDVLGYLHSRQPQVIFRDLKPANIIMTPQGHIYLIDFGLARLFDNTESTNSSPYGSPGYAAPEQYESPQTTEHADIYSLGATLHHLLTGVDPSLHPFEFVPIRFPATSPLAGFGTLIMRMLEKHPSRRPQNMHTVMRELQGVANNLRASSRNAVQSADMRSPAPSGFSITPSGRLSNRSSGPLTDKLHPQTPRGGTGSQSGSNTAPPPVGTTLCVFEGHTGAINGLSWSPDGTLIASIGEDKSVHVWNTTTGAIVQTYQDSGKQAVTAAWSPGGILLAIGFSGDKRSPETLQIVRALTGERVYSYASNAGFWSAQADKTISALAWSSDGARLACGGAEFKIDIFDTQIWRQLNSYKGHNSAINALAWSPDGRQIVSTGADDAIHLWDTASAKNAATYFKHSSIVPDIAWSPNGQRIVSASYDKTAQIWNAITGTTLSTYRGHRERIQSVAWSPDGSRIATAARDGSVHIWDASKGTVLFIYTDHNDGVNAVRWSPDGKRLATAGADKTARVWRAI